MITSYFGGINFSQSSFPGFYVLDYRGQSYYACAYRDRNRGKTAITELMKSLKTFPKYKEGEFDFHHIVERPHLADISFGGNTVNTNYPAMPTVMIHKGEHNRYNMILRAGETRELYMRTKGNLPATVEESEKMVREMLASSKKDEAKLEIARRIDILTEIYRGVYEKSSILKIISTNILKSYRSRLENR